jgi:hypothetical protein
MTQSDTEDSKPPRPFVIANDHPLNASNESGANAMPIPNDVVPVNRDAAIEFILSGLRSYGRQTGARAESLYLFARRDVEAYRQQREAEFASEVG